MTFILAFHLRLNFLVFSLPVSISFFPISKCKKLPPASFGHLPNAISSNNNAIMPRKDDDDDRRQRDEDDDERRRRREDEAKRRQRKKKARRPDLSDTNADLGIANLLDNDDDASPPQDAGISAAVEEPNLGDLFAPAVVDEDELLRSSAGEEDEEEAAPFEDEEEGMDVDTTDDSPSNPSAPIPPQEQPRSGTILCHKEASPTEVEIGPLGDWAPSRQADGSYPETTREIGIQANVGLERLARRQTWLKASRRRYRLNRLKRRREASLPRPAPVPEEASASPAPPAPPQAKRPRPSYLLPKKAPTSSNSPPETSQGQKGATRGGGVANKGASRGGLAAKPKRGRGGKGGQVAKDQRVVVLVPPEVPATKAAPAPKETARVPSKRESQTLPQNQERERPKGGRSLSRSRRDEVVASKERRERREEFPRRRSPSPGPSSRRSSLPPSMPTMFSMNTQEVQWMVTAIATAFEAQQRFRQQQQEQPPESPPSRSRSTSRKGKGPGKGKGRGRGR